ATLKELISQTMVRWSQEDEIQDPELVRIMYTLLRRQYDSIGELLQALRKAYTISAASVQDTINLLAALGQIRSLLSVRMGKEEELLMINGLGYGITTLYCVVWGRIPSPALLPTLLWLQPSTQLPAGLHESTAGSWGAAQHPTPLSLFLQDCSQPSLHPAWICAWHWLCPAAGPCMCGTSCSWHWLTSQACQDLVAQDACEGSVVTYLAGCGLQSCPVLLAKGYPDIGWNPIEGERYLSFLRFAVFVNSE
ncbi:RYR1 protein, partial [Indicator maculatus]|nr:RYR1 protein [Indicator maculatus]